MNLPAIPQGIKDAIVQGVLEGMRRALLPLTEFLVDHSVWKPRLRITPDNHVWLEVARRVSTPGQERWVQYFDFGPLP